MARHALADARFALLAFVDQGAQADLADHDLEPLADDDPIGRFAEQLEEATIVEHQPVVGVPQRKAFGHRLGRLHQVIVRGTQLVEIGRKTRHHAVEGAADAGHLVGAGRRDPDGELAVGDPIRALRQVLQTAGQEEAHGESDHGDRHHAGNRDADAEVQSLAIGPHQRIVRELDRQAAQSARLTPDLGLAPVAVPGGGRVGAKATPDQALVGGGHDATKHVAHHHRLHPRIPPGALDEGLQTANSSVSRAARLRSPSSCKVTASVLAICSWALLVEWPREIQSTAAIRTISSAKMVAAMRYLSDMPPGLGRGHDYCCARVF